MPAAQVPSATLASSHSSRSGSVEAPAGAQLVDPPPEPLEVGGREREHAAHRCERGEVEHVDGGTPAGQRGDDGAERGRHRVLRAEREIAHRDRHRQPTATEHGRRERRETADVGAHHEHVSRFESRVGDEAGVEGVAEGVELAQRAVARVHLHRGVRGSGERGGRAVLDDVALEVAQQGGRRRGVVGAGPHDDRVTEAADEAGRLERRTPPRAHEGMSAEGVVVVGVAPAGDQASGVERRGTLPGARRRGHDEHVDVADRAEGVEHLELGGREGAGAEQCGARRDRRLEAPGPQVGQPLLAMLGRVGLADALAHGAEQLELPRHRGVEWADQLAIAAHRAVPRYARRPLRQDAGAVRGVLVEEVGDVAGDDVLTGSGARRGRAPARHADAAVAEHVDHGPREAGDRPRIVGVGDGRVEAERHRREAVGEREGDVGGDAAAAGEVPPHPVAHPRGRHGDDLGRERIGQRFGERGHELVGERPQPRAVEHAQRHVPGVANGCAPARPSQGHFSFNSERKVARRRGRQSKARADVAGAGDGVPVAVGAGLEQVAAGGGDGAEGDEREGPTDRDPGDAEPGELGDGWHAGEGEHVHRTVDLAHHPADVGGRHQPRGVQHVGARLLVRLQPGDGVAEVVDAVEVVLAARGQDDPGRTAVRRLGGGDHAFARPLPRRRCRRSPGRGPRSRLPPRRPPRRGGSSRRRPRRRRRSRARGRRSAAAGSPPRASPRGRSPRPASPCHRGVRGCRRDRSWWWRAPGTRRTPAPSPSRRRTRWRAAAAHPARGGRGSGRRDHSCSGPYRRPGGGPRRDSAQPAPDATVRPDRPARRCSARGAGTTRAGRPRRSVRPTTRRRPGPRSPPRRPAGRRRRRARRDS